MKNLSRLSFAAALFCAMPAWAQEPPAPTQPMTPPMIAMPPAANGGWGNEAFEKQELREEMVQIRKEYEELDAATDALLDRCIKPGAGREACEKEKLDLQERRAQLHARRQALRDKIDADRKEKAAQFAMPHGLIPLSQPVTAPMGSAPPVPPPNSQH